MQPAELLQDLCVVRVSIENPSVSCFGRVVLHIRCQQEPGTSILRFTHVFALFMNMTNLEPDVFLSQWPWWILDNVLEALKAD